MALRTAYSSWLVSSQLQLTNGCLQCARYVNHCIFVVETFEFESITRLQQYVYLFFQWSDSRSHAEQTVLTISFYAFFCVFRVFLTVATGKAGRLHAEPSVSPMSSEAEQFQLPSVLFTRWAARLERFPQRTSTAATCACPHPLVQKRTNPGLRQAQH